MKKIIFFDTTLRDGEQSPGASMTIDQKLKIASLLETIGVDVIEAGFPASSKLDFDSVSAISKQITEPIVAALARSTKKDVEIAAQALENATKKRIHTFIATSDIHISQKLKKTHEEVLKMAVDAIKLAKTYCDDVEFSAEDATRSNRDFLCEVISKAIDSGATTINIPDTVGYTLPWEFASLLECIRNNVSNISNAKISVHFHDDLGLATANSLAAIHAGIDQVESTVNGIGERAGNAALEEIAMALKVKHDQFDIKKPDIETRHFMRLSRLVARSSGIAVQRNKAIVGKNAFAHESGIHQAGVISSPDTYEIIRAEDVGQKTRLVLGVHSGHHAISAVLTEAGLFYTQDQLDQIRQEIKNIAQNKKVIKKSELIKIYHSL